MLSCGIPPCIPPSDFMLFLARFFLLLPVGSIGLLVLRLSWPAGPVVWAEATEVLPASTRQHVATTSFRILYSPVGTEGLERNGGWRFLFHAARRRAQVRSVGHGVGRPTPELRLSLSLRHRASDRTG